jgi:hypothetical protein
MLARPMGRRTFTGLLTVAVAALVPDVLAQAGYKTFENKLKGVTFVYPTTHAELPLPPTEALVVAKYVMKAQPEEMKRIDERLFQAQTPFLEVFRFSLPTTKTGGAVPTPAGGRPDAGKPDAGKQDAGKQDAGKSDAAPASGAAPLEMTWEQFVAGIRSYTITEDEKKPGHYELRPRRGGGGGAGGARGRGGAEPIGYLVRRVEGNTVLGVAGFSFDVGEKTLVSQVTRMAASLKLLADDAGDRAEADLDKLYASGKYKAVEWRKQARAKMAAGWKALDTENYLIVHHSTNQGLIRRIARDIEAMRAFYGEQFPPPKPIDAVAVVRVCRTLDEYHDYGGPRGTGGYWHPGNEELVFFDYSYTMQQMDSREKRALGGQRLTDDDSLLVLYHEALHQYMHYAVGQFAPHDWFNEGYGDYFSGAVVGESTGRVVRVDPSPWRIHVAKDMLEFGDGYLSLKDVLHADRATFYNPQRAGNYYAAAWSFVFFLKHDKAALAHPQWSKLLATYYETVKAVYAAESKGVGDDDRGGREVASFKARKAALAKTLEGVDLVALEAAWKKYVVGMRDPWPALRKKRR